MKNMWKGIMCIVMHENDTIKEANCLWVIRKSIGLYAENDAEVINVLAYSELCKDKGSKHMRVRSKKGLMEASWFFFFFFETA